ncbi:YbaK/EbsC family protein [Georgenia sp. SYP-B2076]|uniref:YbaK/EbsC family protein n=1 Tax=Georgenia sp. SYP-B2076 TaxID=2495881 RepID=UPI000F8E8D27|nr:YbaK/EbsC family protein [Georgenia sp. SYP-B2076]
MTEQTPATPPARSLAEEVATEPTAVLGETDAVALGTLVWEPALDRPDLLAEPVRDAVADLALRDPDAASQVLVAEIDPDLADTAAMTEAYELPPEASANCVLVAGRRAGEERVAACVVRATTRTDVNTAVRRILDVRKASFWPMEQAVAASGMEYGGITPVGLPAGWRLLVDSRVATGHAIIGSGVRRSKLLVPGEVLAALPGAQVVEGLGQPVG